MKNNIIRIGLSFGIIFLFIFSCFTQIVVGDYKSSELERNLSDIIWFCTTPYGFDNEKYEYYKEILINQYSSANSNNNLIIRKNDRFKTQIEIPREYLKLGPMESAWPMLCHDTRHTSRSPYSTASNPYDEKWRFFTDGMVEVSPIIDRDGIIYFGGSFNLAPWYLFAIYPNGALKWKFKTGSLIFSTSAIADDGTIYVGSWDNFLYAINSDGTLKWKFPSNNADIASSPAIANDGTIYFGDLGDFGYNSRIYAVNPDGTEKWSYIVGDRIYSDPCIGTDGTIYIGSNDEYLYAMNPDGTLKWKFKTGAAYGGSASIADDGTIYAAGSWDDYLYALYPDGKIKWKCNIKVNSNPSIGSDGTIYIGAYQLYAVYPDGNIKWSFNLGDNRWIGGSDPAISADGTIYFGTCIGDADGGEVIAVNHDGTDLWRKKISDSRWVKSSPSIGEDGTVYIGSYVVQSVGYLHAFGKIESNSPPGITIISGPTQGKTGVSYRYYFVAVDPDNNPIELFVDWGDGSSGWVDTIASGETKSAEHTWSVEGSYTIKAKVKDVMGEEGPENMFNLTIKPNSRALFDFNRLSFLERFPLLQKILYLIKI